MIDRLLTIQVWRAAAILLFLHDVGLRAQTSGLDAALTNALRMVVDSAQDGFADLRGEILAGAATSDHWSVMFVLPGFKNCHLVQEHQLVQQPSHARHLAGNSTVNEYFWYGCEDFRWTDAPEREYRVLLTTVAQATGWQSREVASEEHSMIFNEAPRGSSILVTLSAKGLSLAVFPPQTVSPLSAGASGSSNANRLRTEIARIESARDTSPLPDSLASVRQNFGSKVSRTLENRTPYVLAVLLSGTIDRRVLVPARTKQTFEIPAGRYKVAARLLGQDLPPLFGVEEYLSGHDYTSNFVIQGDLAEGSIRPVESNSSEMPSSKPNGVNPPSTSAASLTSGSERRFQIEHRMGVKIKGELIVADNRIEWHPAGNQTSDHFAVTCDDIKSVRRAGGLTSFKGNSWGGSELRLDLLNRNYLMHAANSQDRDEVVSAINKTCASRSRAGATGKDSTKTMSVDRPSAAANTNVDSKEQIEYEIEKIEFGGEFLPLPEPLVSDRLGPLRSATLLTTNGGLGIGVIPTVGRTFDNRTPYAITVLLTGAVVRRISLSVGSTTSIDMPAGRYKVAARLLAPDFPPLFAIQEYVAGHDYKTDFVIQ